MPEAGVARVRRSTLSYRRLGRGPDVLLVHGGSEDASLLAPFARAVAARGYRVTAYDRRGTGRSGREDWPGGGAVQHADDAAALLDALDARGAAVIGLSSGGVVALALAARHAHAVGPVVAWEPPMVAMLAAGEAVSAELVAPVDAHLAAHPGDHRGAGLVLLSALAGVDLDGEAPEVAALLANAEAFVRDDARFVGQATLEPGALAPGRVVVAVSEDVAPLLGEAADAVRQVAGAALARLATRGHTPYLDAPEAFAAALADLIGPGPWA
jgi:pimeloyl-ACP methyl ester carboxylesterase